MTRRYASAVSAAQRFHVYIAARTRAGSISPRRSTSSATTRVSAVGPRVSVGRRHEQRVPARDLAQHREVAGDDGQVGGHRLEDGQSEALGGAREAQCEGVDEEPGEDGGRDVAEEPHAIGETELLHECLEAGGVASRRTGVHERRELRDLRPHPEEEREVLARHLLADGQHVGAVVGASRGRRPELDVAERRDDDPIALDAPVDEIVGRRLRDREHGAGTVEVPEGGAQRPDRARGVQLGVIDRVEVLHRHHERASCRGRQQTRRVHDVHRPGDALRRRREARRHAR